jgi:hypothetical protein
MNDAVSDRPFENSVEQKSETKKSPDNIHTFLDIETRSFGSQTHYSDGRLY